MMTVLFVSELFAQDLSQSKASIDSTNFYIFSEAGGQYVPSIKFNNTSSSESFAFRENVSGFDIAASGTYGRQISNFIIQPEIGYNFILGFGYQLSENLGIEIEAGYSQVNLRSGSFTINDSLSGNLSVNGTPIAEGTLSFNGTQTIEGSANLTQIPILISLAVQERSNKFQPMASLGLGVCPTIISGNISTSSFNGTLSASGPGGAISLPLSGSTAIPNQSFDTSTAYPFAFKLKAGFDYAFSQQASFGLRAWAMGLANSDFGNDLQSDLYGAIGLNASLKIQF